MGVGSSAPHSLPRESSCGAIRSARGEMRGSDRVLAEQAPRGDEQGCGWEACTLELVLGGNSLAPGNTAGVSQHRQE